MSNPSESKEAREKRRGRLLAVVAIVVLALLLGWCGRGWIGGGDGGGDGEGDRAAERESESESESDGDGEARGLMGQGAAPAEPCEVRIDGDGLQLAGARADLAVVLAACAKARRAELTVTGEAIYSVVQELEAGLAERDVEVTRK